MDYLYDGSFDGLLTCIYHNYYGQKAEGIYPQDTYQYNLVSSPKAIETDFSLSAKVYDAIEKKISPKSLKKCFYVYLSNHPRKENLILNYLRLGFKLGADIESFHTHKDVLPFQETARKVSLETHRFYGLLRFSQYKDFLYAIFEPDHNILLFQAEHFADRLQGENFIIHDKKRNMAAVYNRREWYLSDFRLEEIPVLANQEDYYQELWAEYFLRIAIDSRKNKGLQSRYIPGRYRHNLVEFKKSFLP